jgi:hypothetical protein
MEKSKKRTRDESPVTNNLKAAKNLYYSIILVTLFLTVTLIENDPARLPALQVAYQESVAYQKERGRLGKAWNELLEGAQGTEKNTDRSFVELYRNKPRAEGLMWGQLASCPSRSERMAEELERKVFLLWTYVQALAGEGTRTMSSSTTAGGSDIIVPTEKPTLDLQIDFSTCLAEMVEDTLRTAHMRVVGTEGAGEGFKAKFVPMGSAGESGTGDQVTVSILRGSPALAKVAFAVNNERLSSTYRDDLRRRLGAVKRSLIDVELWEKVTTLDYNRSLRQANKQGDTTLVSDVSFFNSEALSRVIEDLESEIKTRSKRLRVPLTGYNARILMSRLF